MFYMNDHSVRKWKPIPMDILGRFAVEELPRCGLFLWCFADIYHLPAMFFCSVADSGSELSDDGFDHYEAANRCLPNSSGTHNTKYQLWEGRREGIARAIELAPESADAWTRLCHLVKRNREAMWPPTGWRRRLHTPQLHLIMFNGKKKWFSHLSDKHRTADRHDTSERQRCTSAVRGS